MAESKSAQASKAAQATTKKNEEEDKKPAHEELVDQDAKRKRQQPMKADTRHIEVQADIKKARAAEPTKEQLKRRELSRRLTAIRRLSMTFPVANAEERLKKIAALATGKMDPGEVVSAFDGDLIARRVAAARGRRDQAPRSDLTAEDVAALRGAFITPTEVAMLNALDQDAIDALNALEKKDMDRVREIAGYDDEFDKTFNEVAWANLKKVDARDLTPLMQMTADDKYNLFMYALGQARKKNTGHDRMERGGLNRAEG